MAAEIDLGKVTGDKGEQGDPGSQWYYGTAITGTESTGTVFPGSGIENATVNDKYLNTGTGSDIGNVYTCVLEGDANTAQWSYSGSIRGAQGPQGPQGTTGAVDENTPIKFTEASTLTNLDSGESISVLFGKVAKAVSGLLLGAASTLLSALTANRALISDDNGKVATSSVTKTELEYLSGAQSNIQDQFDTLNQNLGQILKTEEPLASTVESGISTAIASITLPPGKWILNAIAGFSPNGNGFISFNLNEVKGSTGIMVSMLPIDSGTTRVSFSTFMDIDTETVIYLNANQTSGSTLSVNGSRIDAIRVGM